MKKVSMLAMALLIASKGAMAGGFSLTEYSTTSLGRGFAGMGLVGDDYSAIVSNPAGMSLSRDGMQIGVSFVDIYANIDDRKDDNHESLNIFSPVPSIFAQTSLSDKMKLGFAFYTPYGIGTEYKKGWWGRDEALLSEIVVYDLTVSSSYDLTNKLSIGASLSTQFATAKLTNNLSKTKYGVDAEGNPIYVDLPASHLLYSDINGDNGDDLTLAYTLGAMYKVNENNRYGISYRSKSTYHLEGTHKLSSYATTLESPYTLSSSLTLANGMTLPAGYTLPVDATLPAGAITRNGTAHATVTLPENIMVSSYHKLDDKLALSATAKWTRWSRFKELNIYSDANGAEDLVSSTKENWRDTWTFSVGADYDYTKDWTLRAGLEVEKTPIPNDEHRTARIPDDNRLITALGASYKFDGGKLDLAYAHVFIDGGESKYSEKNPGGFDTEYDLHINMFSASVQYYF